MKKQLFYIILIWVCSLSVPAISFSQPFSPSVPPPPPDDTIDALDIPFDGGLSLLLAAGVGYGVKRVRDQRRKEKRKK